MHGIINSNILTKINIISNKVEQSIVENSFFHGFYTTETVCQITGMKIEYELWS